MKSMRAFGLVTVLSASVALAGTPTQLNLSVESGGSASISVSPGQVVGYQVVASLSDTANQGLALFGFDVCYTCGGVSQSLPQMTLPNVNCMNNFEIPLGITNPRGFGGTTGVLGREDCLVQVGGATNTINNVESNAPYPLGGVCLDIALTPTVLAEGTLTIPADAAPGTQCTVTVSNVFANVVRAGEVDDGTFWAVDPVDQGTTGDLTMTVIDCALLSSKYNHEDTLPRFQNNVLRLTFDCDITMPATGEVCVAELLDNGAFGADLSSQFLFSVENDDMNNPRVLRIEEDGDVLADMKWYGLRNCGWPDVADFGVHYVTVFGDANNDCFNDFADLSAIFGKQTGSAADNSRNDINADGFVDFSDLSAAFGFNGSFCPDKPTGHDIAP